MGTIDEHTPSVSEELEPLTDSLSSAIRWRFTDYGGFLKTELEILAQVPPLALADRPAQSSPHWER